MTDTNMNKRPGFRMLWIAALLLGLAAMMTSTPTDAAPPSDKWLTTLEAGKARAAETNKPLFVMVSASWCPPCNQWKAEILPTEQVQKKLDGMVLVYIDGDENRRDMMTLEAEAYPTFILMDAKGEEMGRTVGSAPTSEDFLRELSVIEEFARKLAEIETRLEASPEDATLWREKGDLLIDLGNQIEEGLAAYKTAQRLDPEDKTGVAVDLQFFEILQKAESEGDLVAAKSALAQFGQANALHKRAGDALYLRAIIELESNNIESAKPLLAEYLARHPDGRFKSNVERIQEQIRQMEAERPELPAVYPPAPRE